MSGDRYRFFSSCMVDWLMVEPDSSFAEFGKWLRDHVPDSDARRACDLLETCLRTAGVQFAILVKVMDEVAREIEGDGAIDHPKDWKDPRNR